MSDGHSVSSFRIGRISVSKNYQQGMTQRRGFYRSNRVGGGRAFYLFFDRGTVPNPKKIFEGWAFVNFQREVVHAQKSEYKNVSLMLGSVCILPSCFGFFLKRHL